MSRARARERVSPLDKVGDSDGVAGIKTAADYGALRRHAPAEDTRVCMRACTPVATS